MIIPAYHELREGETNPPVPDAGYAQIYFVNGELRIRTTDGVFAVDTGNADGASRKWGTATIANASAEVAVEFATEFAVTPTHVETVVIEKASPADDDVFVTAIQSLSTSGFTARLSAPVANGNYKLHWTIRL